MRLLLRSLVAVTAAIALTQFVAPASTAAESTGPDGGAAGAQWTAAEDGPQTYPNVYIEWDVPITMSDGTVLKANVYHPADAAGRPIADPTPTIVNFTPYTKLGSMIADSMLSIPGLSDMVVQLFRNIDLTGTPISGLTDLTKALGGGLLRTFTVDRQLIKSGYTQVVVDVRGTGFSQGIWDVLGPREQLDTVETIDWASRQSWSTGDIGLTGISYSGLNQLQAAAKNPPALQAIFPVVPSRNPFRDLVAPGGAVGVTFMPMWLAAVNGGKLVPDMTALLQGRFDMAWLASRLADPFTFVDALLEIFLQPDIDQLSPKVRQLLDSGGDLRRSWETDPAQITVPTFITGGWHDVFVASQADVYRRLAVPPGQKQILIGDGYHISNGNESGRPGQPPRMDVLQRAWFDKWLKGIDNGIDTYGPVTMKEQGGAWITASGFPDEDAIEHQRMYLSPVSSGTGGHSVHDGSLFTAPSEWPETLTVAPGLTGLCSRDAAQETIGIVSVIDACGKDSRIWESNGLTFTSAPVGSATTISGPIAVHLNTVHDTADGYWVATVNDVAPDGTSVTLSSGQLVASLRAIDESRSTRSPNGDYTDPVPDLSLDTRQRTEPGVPVTLDISIAGVDAVLQPGHRLRVDVYAGNFPKGLPPLAILLDSGLRPQHLLLDPAEPSYVNIPLRGNPGW
ncbi:CocE/NonD family hydrolase [Nocardia huaxiensis]|uniref:CocE/NonD family hydrolase n=1 Tax=Nocardia huaxiensis TaxID=2755382 RepID=A0A7D6ZZC6_9NOCA|nr:CocE/NonD family hydrolase [Nocardia huaxiensis]QLY32249.1 CocE/NonD family hydrolase [Nocardia huaxiensis]UFS94045.1 CocE/NonD family hydrolase [Nocardia huaxiensis]